jgi:hypothetical protein
MAILNEVLLMFHFVGLVLGLSVPVANIALRLVMAKSAPPERAILARFPPVMSRFGKVGLTLLWLTGPILLKAKWGGFALMPWQFHAKLTAVVLLTLTVIVIHRLEGRVRAGDLTAIPKIENAGKAAMLFGLLALIFAVLTFN